MKVLFVWMSLSSDALVLLFYELSVIRQAFVVFYVLANIL